MDSLSSNPTSHNVVESFDAPKEEDPKVKAEKTEQEKEKDELEKLLNESMAVYKNAITNTIKKIREGDVKDEQ